MVNGNWVAGLDDMPLTNGSWVGFSVAAGEYESATQRAIQLHKHAPISPDGTYVAYVATPTISPCKLSAPIISTPRLLTTTRRQFWAIRR